MDHNGSSESSLLKQLAKIIGDCLRLPPSTRHEEPYSSALSKVPELWELGPGHGEQLRALWNFADIFFHATSHGDSDVEGMPIVAARNQMFEAVELVLDGGEITNAHILAYARYTKP